MVLCECSALVLLVAEGGIPISGGEQGGWSCCFPPALVDVQGRGIRSSSSSLCQHQSRSTGNPFAGSGSAEPSQLLTGIPHTHSPLSSTPPLPPPKNPQSFLSPLFFCAPLNFFCLTPRCSAAFCAQNNFCSGNSSPSLSALLQYFSLAFALRDVAEH